MGQSSGKACYLFLKFSSGSQGYISTLNEMAFFLAHNFSDSGSYIVNSDVKNNIIESLACFVCYPESLKSLEQMSLQMRKAMIKTLLSPYESRSVFLKLLINYTHFHKRVYHSLRILFFALRSQLPRAPTFWPKRAGSVLGSKLGPFALQSQVLPGRAIVALESGHFYLKYEANEILERF